MGAVDWIKQNAQSWADNRLGDDFCHKIRTLGTRQNEYGYDPFGFHRDDARLAMAVVHTLYRRYFRVQVHGIENVPEGRCLLVANHSGQLPWDGVNVVSSLIFDREPPRIVRSMVEKF